MSRSPLNICFLHIWEFPQMLVQSLHMYFGFLFKITFRGTIPMLINQNCTAILKLKCYWCCLSIIIFFKFTFLKINFFQALYQFSHHLSSRRPLLSLKFPEILQQRYFGSCFSQHAKCAIKLQRQGLPMTDSFMDCDQFLVFELCIF